MSQVKRVKTTPKEASLGLDFGTSSSKMTLAYMQRINDQEGVTISRIPIAADLGHPDRSQDGMAHFEFVAFAALVDGRLEFGRRCLDQDTSYPLKTMFSYLAGINPEKLSCLPGGNDLIEATSVPREITEEMIRDVLNRYFKWLRDQALVQATSINVAIKRLVLTYPTYLCEDQEVDDVNKYMELYRKLIIPLWSECDITVYFLLLEFKFATRGTSVSRDVCEPTFNSHNTFRRSSLWEFLQDPDEKNKPLNIAVADNGSSTLNIQVQSVYFDEEGEFLCSQSNVGQNWRAGTLGGSYLSNDRVKGYIERAIKTPDWPSGELAVLLRRFEERKRVLDAQSHNENIVLIGSHPNRAVWLSPKRIQRYICAAFDSGIKVLESEVERLLKLGRDFAVVLCGGSYCNPGHLRHVQHCLDYAQIRARRKGIRLKHAVLANFDPSGWQSAVSAGAAISVWPLPSPYDIFLGSSVGRSALGIQRLKKDRVQEWIGSKNVKVLLSVGCNPLSYFQANVGKKTQSRIIYRLICDPQYEDKTGQTPIIVEDLEETLNGPICPYDLGFEVEATQLPLGYYRFSIEGRDAAILAAGQRSVRKDTIVLWLLCRAISRPDISDKRWKLVVQTDPATKLLFVEDTHWFPARCQNPECLTDFQRTSGRRANRCTKCPWFCLCYSCFHRMGNREAPDHDDTHIFEQVIVAPEPN
ncbi:hypothetical protein F5B22DRAFT_644478 [Xylaria bambusicola]|uniref:uncharacterized protein n=1 Tax=Xylaria bambusicola TaxID=326684 RepID=UPI00200884AC|nr:uncharacterized protein F5B22DRAFT_644478 [Xylaria bambusicola]KAI0520729.1 hypothetical protein F5B22DRAFT_644478 [Xylaria bambusicola]